MRNFLGSIGDFLSGGKNKEAREALEAATGEFEFDIPKEEALDLERIDYAGDFTPDMLQALTQERSGYADIEMDPRLKAAQLQALGGFQDIVDSEGLTSEDQFRLAQINQDQSSRERGSREAILQNAAQRGIAGSGLELLSQMQNQQDFATRANMQGLGVNAQAQAAKRAALEGLASTGGNIRGQDFGEQSRAADAQDSINRFNTANSQDVSKFNVNNANQGRLRNLDTRQDLSGRNAGIANTQAQFNQGLAGRDSDREFERRKARANTMAGRANLLNDQGKMIPGLVGGAVEAGAAAYGK